jgi:uncharacterized phage-like protein YoqJ
MILAATGHRPDKLGGYSGMINSELQSLAEKELFRLKPKIVIVGMALGWDQAVGWAAKAQRIPFLAYVPFEGQESVWPAASKERYRELLSYAQKIIVCSPGEFTPRKMQVRNEAMVDHCDEILALWDGSPGGTGNCMAYARARGRTIHNCWQAWTSR